MQFRSARSEQQNHDQEGIGVNIHVERYTVGAMSCPSSLFRGKVGKPKPNFAHCNTQTKRKRMKTTGTLGVGGG